MSTTEEIVFTVIPPTKKFFITSARSDVQSSSAYLSLLLARLKTESSSALQGECTKYIVPDRSLLKTIWENLLIVFQSHIKNGKTIFTQEDSDINDILNYLEDRIWIYLQPSMRDNLYFGFNMNISKSPYFNYRSDERNIIIENVKGEFQTDFSISRHIIPNLNFQMAVSILKYYSMLFFNESIEYIDLASDSKSNNLNIRLYVQKYESEKIILESINEYVYELMETVDEEDLKISIELTNNIEHIAKIISCLYHMLNQKHSRVSKHEFRLLFDENVKPVFKMMMLENFFALFKCEFELCSSLTEIFTKFVKLKSNTLNEIFEYLLSIIHNKKSLNHRDSTGMTLACLLQVLKISHSSHFHQKGFANKYYLTKSQYEDCDNYSKEVFEGDSSILLDECMALLLTACEIGSLMISACFNSIVKGSTANDSNISPYQSSWNFSSPEFCVDTLATVVLVSFKENCKSNSPQEEVEMLQIFVDLIVSYSRALLGNNEFVKAKHYLDQASSISSYILENLSTKTQEDQKKHYYICELLADSCLKNNLDNEAEIHLKSIPKEFRNVKNCMKLGDIYMKNDKSREAVACYQDVLRLDRYSISAVEKLIKLGLPEDKKKNLTDYYKKEDWLAKLVDVKYYSHNNQHEKLIHSLKSLEKSFPNNVELKLNLAECYDQLSKYDEAIELFKKCYKMDAYTDCKSSTFATLLQTTGHPVELQSLSTRLLKTNKGSAECWLVLAIYYTSRTTLFNVVSDESESNKNSLQQNMEMAIRAVDKALELNPSFILAYLWKGHLLLMAQQPNKAILIYKQAKKISTDIRIYQGLVKAHLSIPQHFQDALNIALSAQKLNGKFDYKPHILLGSVYTMKEEFHDNAQKAFESALKICQETKNEFGMEEALLGKVELDIKRQHFDSAIKTLQSPNLKQNTDIIQTKLGQIYILQQRFEDAFQCFHKALSLNRFNEIARQELLKLEESVPQDEEEQEEDYEM